MSVYVVAALARERRRLHALSEALEDRTNTPPSVIALVRSARQDLVEAEAHMRVLLDRAEPEARSS